MASQKSEIIIELKIDNVGKALSMAEDMANVRGSIGYSLEHIGDKRWKITLTRGKMENLLKAVKKNPFVKLVEDEGESIDVELDF